MLGYSDKLIDYLKLYVYKQIKCTPELWKNTKTGIICTPSVDDFLVKYTFIKDVENLVDALTNIYNFRRPEGKTILWIRFKIELNTCEISMPGCVKFVLNSRLYNMPMKPQYLPYP